MGVEGELACGAVKWAYTINKLAIGIDAMEATVEEVIKLAEQLPVEDQNRLMNHLRMKQVATLTHDNLLREVELLRQIPVRPDNSLLGKYANAQASSLSEEQFHAELHAIATEWEQELDEFTNTS